MRLILDTADGGTHQIEAELVTRDKRTQVTVNFTWQSPAQSPWLTRGQLGAYLQFLEALAENTEHKSYPDAERQIKGFIQNYVSPAAED